MGITWSRGSPRVGRSPVLCKAVLFSLGLNAEDGGWFLGGVEADDVLWSYNIVAVVLDELMELIGGRFMDAEFF